MFGLCGAQRVGKSTLAQAFAQAQGIPFVATSASEVMRRIGLDPKEDYPVETRLLAQEALLAAFEVQYRQAQKLSRMWIADRTPIDLASYMLGDIQRGTLAGKPELSGFVTDYVRRCLEATGRHFSLVVLVQPGIELVEAPGKAPACVAHMEHLNALQMGLLADKRNLTRCFSMPRHVTNLDERVSALVKVASAAFDAEQVLQQSRTMH